MRTALFIANWKMHKTVHEAAGFARELSQQSRQIAGVELVLAPPFTALAAVAEVVRSTPIGVAAQDVYFEKSGAFTGEVSAAMARDAGADYAIVGHSERRRLFGDTDVIVNRKVAAAIDAELTPIMCIGETIEERDRHETLAVLDRQLKQGLELIRPDQAAGLVVAYEPVWAIGTGRNATPQEAGEAHAHLRRRLRQWFGADASERCRIVYGGSVKPDNTRALMNTPDVDGALVGGASLEVATFLAIVLGAQGR